MKRIIVFILAVLMALTACSKVQKEPEIPESSSEPGTVTNSAFEEQKEPEKEKTFPINKNACVSLYKNNDNRYNFIPLEIGTHPDGTETYYLDMLSDKELEAEINAFILEKTKEVSEGYEELLAHIDECDKENEGYPFRFGTTWPFYASHIEGQKTSVIAYAKNGYFSVAVSLPYYFALQDGWDLFYDTETAVWDMLSGKRLSEDELFCDGVDKYAALNEYLETAAYQTINEFKHTNPLVDGLKPLEEVSGWHLDLGGIYFDFGGGLFEEGARLHLDHIKTGVLVTDEYRDMTECFEEKYQENVFRFFTESPEKTVWEVLEEDNEYTDIIGKFSYQLIDENEFETAKAINDVMRGYYDKYYHRKTVCEFFKDYIQSEDDYYYIVGSEYWGPHGYLSIIGDKYAVFDTPRYWKEIPANDYASYYKEDIYIEGLCFIFDLETGEEISFLDMLTEKGRQKANGYLHLIDPPGGVYVRENGIEVSYTNNYDSVRFYDDEIIWDW